MKKNQFFFLQNSLPYARRSPTTACCLIISEFSDIMKSTTLGSIQGNGNMHPMKENHM